MFNAIEKAGKTRIASVEDFLNFVDSGDTKIKQSIKDQSQMYMCQLKAYLRRYTGGELHARVTQTRSDGIMDLLRDIVYNGKNRNPNRLIELKAKALSPPRAAKTADVDRVLTEWKYVRRQTLEEDPNYKLDDETLQTLLMKIIPNDFVKSMRELLTQGGILTSTTGSNKHCSTRSAQGKWTKTLEREALVFMQLVVPQSFQNKKTRLHISIKMTSNTRGGAAVPHQWIGTS